MGKTIWGKLGAFWIENRFLDAESIVQTADLHFSLMPLCYDCPLVTSDKLGHHNSTVLFPFHQNFKGPPDHDTVKLKSLRLGAILPSK